MSKRYLLFYVTSLVLVLLGFKAIARQGEQLVAAPDLDGDYRAVMVGGPLPRLQLHQSGRFIHAELTRTGQSPVTLSGTLAGDRLQLETPGPVAGLPRILHLMVRATNPPELRLGDQVLRRQPRAAAASEH